ncbi:MAG: diacylglycerol kinase family lipid kinase [Clostridia bacterium]|nr:diacylglycerol kinase family lipid kinase [Clostridia bacterium]
MLDFIINPNAGSFKGRKLKKTLKIIETYLAKHNIPYTIHRTNYKNHAKTLTSNLITNGATDIIGIGGDGTLHEIINGFHSFDKVNLGLIPCGTGNDFATAIGLPKKKPLKALEIILNNDPVYTDYMQMPGIRGMNIIGAGLDVVVLSKYEKLKHKNKLSYYVCLLKALLTFDNIKFTATTEEGSTDYTSFISCIANGKQFGGGMRICSEADVADGKLNFVAVNSVKRSKIPGLLIKFLKGKILDDPGTTMIKTSHIKIDTDTPATVNIDGELYENIPFEVSVVTNKLKMYR